MESHTKTNVYNIRPTGGTFGQSQLHVIRLKGMTHSVQDSPLPAHVQQENIEARLLLLHQLEDALHTQTVG